MLRPAVVAFALCATPWTVRAQAPLPAVDISSTDVQAFLERLPRDAVCDRPIRVIDVGGSKVGVYGVLRPKATRPDERAWRDALAAHAPHTRDTSAEVLQGEMYGSPLIFMPRPAERYRLAR